MCLPTGVQFTLDHTGLPIRTCLNIVYASDERFHEHQSQLYNDPACTLMQVVFMKAFIASTDYVKIGLASHRSLYIRLVQEHATEVDIISVH